MTDCCCWSGILCYVHLGLVLALVARSLQVWWYELKQYHQPLLYLYQQAARDLRSYQPCTSSIPVSIPCIFPCWVVIRNSNRSLWLSGCWFIVALQASAVRKERILFCVLHRIPWDENSCKYPESLCNNISYFHVEYMTWRKHVYNFIVVSTLTRSHKVCKGRVLWSNGVARSRELENS